MTDQVAYYQHKLAFEIDAWDLDAACKAGDRIVVLDARSPAAFARDHIAGAINIPHRTMNADTTRTVDRSALVVTYCDGIGCNASTKGALKMAELGFRVKELIGGLDWWKRDGHAVESGTSDLHDVSCGCDP